jgi:hypothetical protein
MYYASSPCSFAIQFLNSSLNALNIAANPTSGIFAVKLIVKVVQVKRRIGAPATTIPIKIVRLPLKLRSAFSSWVGTVGVELLYERPDRERYVLLHISIHNSNVDAARVIFVDILRDYFMKDRTRGKEKSERGACEQDVPASVLPKSPFQINLGIAISGCIEAAQARFSTISAKVPKHCCYVSFANQLNDLSYSYGKEESARDLYAHEQ